jgi:hypothetical protein
MRLGQGAFSFREAMVPEARFNNADLRKADFHNAILSRASFHGADLRGAQLTVDEDGTEGFGELQPPIFACADLRGSDLSGQPLLFITTDLYGGAEILIRGVRLDQAKLDRNVRLKSFQIVSALTMEKGFASEHGNEIEITQLLQHVAGQVKRSGGLEFTNEQILRAWPEGLTLRIPGSISIPSDDNALVAGMYLSRAAVARYLRDQGVGEPARFGEIASKPARNDRFLGRSALQGAALACNAPLVEAPKDYEWNIYAGSDEGLQLDDLWTNFGTSGPSEPSSFHSSADLMNLAPRRSSSSRSRETASTTSRRRRTEAVRASRSSRPIS